MDELDMQEVCAMFIEECRENVDVLERGLLKMGDGDSSAELLNEVFRAAHSIKGGGATFGFKELSELTHYMETLLDEMRSGNRAVNDADVELLLSSVDIVRELMELGEPGDHPSRQEMQNTLAASVGAAQPSSETTAEVPEVGTEQAWNVVFKPKPELMTRGNDPLLLIREVGRLGQMSMSLDIDSLPEWSDLDPQTCRLCWEATLKGDVTKDAIAEIFEWIEFDCELEINPLKVEGVSPDKEVPVAAPVAAPTPKSTATPATPPSPSKGSASTEASSIRIATDKIDQLINLVGELVITQSMLNRLGSSDGAINSEELRDRLSELERNTRELQENVMRVRMLPMSSGFSRLPRLVRDLSRKLNKKIELVVEGGSTEIDKTILERIMDPLVHLVRNALDHGLETPDEREANGKSPAGTLKLNAYHQSGSVVIEIIDDGRGIDRDRILQLAIERGIVAADETLTDEQVYQLIFAAGFSTAAEVSDVSGRGVGMDVVRRNIMELGGRVDINSQQNIGTTIRIRLPLTLAILDGQLIRTANQDFVIPLLSIIETIEIADSHATRLPGASDVCRFRGEYVPLIHLAKRLRLTGESTGSLVVILEAHGQLLGLVIDEVLGQQQVVIKALEDNYRAVPGVAGATIMSDGSVALILDPPSLTDADNLSAVA
ncbi:MAG: chemotaxis protein CheA [Gammaproteobacteria bacterium]